MKRLILFFIILLFAVGLGVQLAKDPGYSLIAYHGWTIEMPLWALLIVFFIIFSVLSLSFRLIKAILYLPSNYRQHRKAVAHKKAAGYIDQGFIALATGHWQTAEKYFNKALAIQPKSVTAHLAVTHAAHAQSAKAKRDAYAQKAKTTLSNESAKMALQLTQAQHHIDQKQFDKAHDALRTLHPAITKTKYPLTAILLKQVYLNQQDWSALVRLLPFLKRLNLITPTEYQQLEQTCYQHLLEQNPTITWHSMPRHLKTQPELIARYAKQLVKQQQLTEVENLLRQSLNKHWDNSLIHLYGTIITNTPGKQLAWAEKQLKKHPANSELLLTLGYLAKANKLWGKARHYLEQSLQHQPTVTAYITLAQLLEQLNEPTTALKYYRLGLIFCAK